MIGTSTCETIAGTAAAAASLFTVTRTSSLPAWARARTWATVPSTSAVSVLVIDCTTMGRSLPTTTPATSTATVCLRMISLMALRAPTDGGDVARHYIMRALAHRR